MSVTLQNALVFGLVGVLVTYWLQRLLRPFWQLSLSRWFLRRGKVALAMRLRFGKRRS